jgi:hypothetical protein
VKEWYGKEKGLHSPLLHLKIGCEQIGPKIKPREHPFSSIHLLKNYGANESNNLHFPSHLFTSSEAQPQRIQFSFSPFSLNFSPVDPRGKSEVMMKKPTILLYMTQFLAICTFFFICHSLLQSKVLKPLVFQFLDSESLCFMLLAILA